MKSLKKPVRITKKEIDEFLSITTDYRNNTAIDFLSNTQSYGSDIYKFRKKYKNSYLFSEDDIDYLIKKIKENLIFILLVVLQLLFGVIN